MKLDINYDIYELCMILYSTNYMIIMKSKNLERNYKKLITNNGCSTWFDRNDQIIQLRYITIIDEMHYNE